MKAVANECARECVCVGVGGGPMRMRMSECTNAVQKREWGAGHHDG